MVLILFLDTIVCCCCGKKSESEITNVFLDVEKRKSGGFSVGMRIVEVKKAVRDWVTEAVG